MTTKADYRDPDTVLRKAQFASDELVLSEAHVRDGRLCFSNKEAFEKAMSIGAFQVAIPPDFDCEPPLTLCRRFYTDNPSLERYAGHRAHTHPKSKLGYEDRPNQVEQLQIESHLWVDYLPSEVCDSLEQMRALTDAILRDLFGQCGIHPEDIPRITGTDGPNARLCYTTINHYCSCMRGVDGIVEHTDSGFITVIYTDQDGYEVYHENQWCPVKRKDGFFVVNLGDAFDILTRHARYHGCAVLHRVSERPITHDVDRSSFTIYMGPDFDMMLYQYSENGRLCEYEGFRPFSVKKAARMGYTFHERV